MEIIDVSCVDAMNLNCSLFLAMNNKRENIYTVSEGEKFSNS
jgi:hypothetical protein